MFVKLKSQPCPALSCLVRNGPCSGFQQIPFPLMRNMGFRLAAGSVKTARRVCTRRRVVLTGSAASSTIVAGGNGSLDLNKGTFLSRTKGDIFIEARHEFRPRFNPRFVRVA